MSARWDERGDESSAPSGHVLLPMAMAQLDAVMAIEVAAYAFPWSYGNFVDSIVAGHPSRLLYSAAGELLGYFVAMVGVDEIHLLNITIAPAAQGQGHARFLISALIELCGAHQASELWLEVRDSNLRARDIYRRLGFKQVGVRKAYYPVALGRREDAVLMSRKLAAAPAGGDDALE